MKLKFLILSIYLITSVMALTINEMQSGVEKTFSNLKVSQSYYFTIRAYNEKQYIFKIKVKNTYSASSLPLSYIAHTSQTPSTKNQEEGKAFYVISDSYLSGYNIYESLYTVIKSSIEYVTFVLTPSKDIDSVSITITESKPSRFTMHPALLIFIAVILFYCFVGFGSYIYGKCIRKKKSDTGPTTPQTDNYTPLASQNQSPSPEQPFYSQSNQ